MKKYLLPFVLYELITSSLWADSLISGWWAAAPLLAFSVGAAITVVVMVSKGDSAGTFR